MKTQAQSRSVSRVSSVSKGERAYLEDVKKRPTYHDGTPRKRWEQLCDVSKWSWERPPLKYDDDKVILTLPVTEI